MTKRLIPGFVVVFFLSACAAEFGYKTRIGSETYCAVPAERVDILFGGSPRPYKQIGIVSVLGSVFSSDEAMLRKLRKTAADLGADAVIVTGQYQGAMTAPGSQTTVGPATTTGMIMRTGYGASVNAATRSTATAVGMPAMTSSYPWNQGIAIRYLTTWM